MTVREILMAICEENDMTLTEMGKDCGMTQSNLSHLIDARHEEGMNMKISTFLRLLDALGAQLVVQTDTEEEYVVEDE